MLLSRGFLALIWMSFLKPIHIWLKPGKKFKWVNISTLFPYFSGSALYLSMPSLIMHWGIKSSRVDTAWRLSTGGVWQWLWSHGERRPRLQEKIINEGKGEKKTLPQPIIKSYVLFTTQAGCPWISCTIVVEGGKKIKMPLL